MTHPIFADLWEGKDTLQDRPALLCGDYTWTFRQFFDQILRAEAGLRALGVRAGELVTILSMNTPETIAAFYPPAKPGQIRLALGNMIRVTRLLAAPDGPRRRIVEKGMGLAGPGNAQMLMLDQANPHCDWAPGELMPLYDQALANFPEMARELYSHLTRGTPLGALFTEPFG